MNASYKNAEATLQSKIRSLESELNAAITQRDHYKKENDIYSAERVSSLRLIEESKANAKQIAELANKGNDLTSENNQYKKTLEDITNKCKAIKFEHTQLKQELVDTQKQLGAYKEKSIRLEQSIASLDSKYKDLQSININR
jgi:uncharacterized coiled-coil DUF342 family protein